MFTASQCLFTLLVAMQLLRWKVSSIQLNKLMSNLVIENLNSWAGFGSYTLVIKCSIQCEISNICTAVSGLISICSRPHRWTQPGHPLWVGTVSNTERLAVNRHTTRCTGSVYRSPPRASWCLAESRCCSVDHRCLGRTLFYWQN